MNNNHQIQKIKIALGSDHAGWKLKNSIKQWLLEQNYQVCDVGCFDEKRVDFVPFAQKVANLVSQKQVDYGILCCFSGTGMAIASNRFLQVRAIRVGKNDESLLKLARQHNDVNLLTLGSNFVNFNQAKTLIQILLQTDFLNLERYCQRNQLLDQNVCRHCLKTSS